MDEVQTLNFFVQSLTRLPYCMLLNGRTWGSASEGTARRGRLLRRPGLCWRGSICCHPSLLPSSVSELRFGWLLFNLPVKAHCTCWTEFEHNKGTLLGDRRWHKCQGTNRCRLIKMLSRTFDEACNLSGCWIVKCDSGWQLNAEQRAEAIAQLHCTK